MAKSKLFLKTTEGVKVKQTMFGNTVRFTTTHTEVDENGNSFYRLVAITRKDRFLWVHPNFSA